MTTFEVEDMTIAVKKTEIRDLTSSFINRHRPLKEGQSLIIRQGYLRFETVEKQPMRPD